MQTSDNPFINDLNEIRPAFFQRSPNSDYPLKSWNNSHIGAIFKGIIISLHKGGFDVFVVHVYDLLNS